MRITRLFCITFVFCLYGMSAKGQTTSNEGLDFWPVFPTHIPTSPNTLAKMSVYSTAQHNSSGKVTFGNEAYLALPKEAMGQEYYAIGHEGTPVPTDEENGY